MNVSVVIATYNGEKYILEQLNSLLEQSCPPNEVIISDDCSTDNTVEISQKFIEEHQLQGIWRINVNKENKGYAKNFLDATALAHGEVIFFCDQDDIWESNKIFNMVNVLKENEELNILASNLKPFTYETDTRKWDKKQLKELNNQSGEVLKVLFNKSNFHLKRSGCTMCIRRHFLNDIRSYWIDNWAHDDFIWKMGLANNSLAILQEVTTNRRMHSNNATVIRVRSKEWRINQLKNVLKQEEKYLDYIKLTSSIPSEDKIKIVKKNIFSIQLRLDLIENKKILNWFRLFIFYRECYPRKKGLYLDLYLTFKKQYKGL